MSISRTSIFLAILLSTFFTLSETASAGRVTVINNSSREAHLPFIFYDYGRRDFYIHGWYKVPAGTKKLWDFRIAPDRKFYWYGKSSDNKFRWPINGDHKQTVIYKAMNMTKAAARTYADAKVVNFATRETDAEGNITIKLR